MRLFLTAAVLAAFSLPAAPARAHIGPCAARAEFLASLASRFSEFPSAMALTKNGWLLEVHSTGDGKTWTMTVTHPSGTTCGLVSGTAWETIAPALGREASRTPRGVPDAVRPTL